MVTGLRGSMVKVMATTEVDIWNLALNRIRASSVGEKTERTPQAESCRIFYPEARDYVLSIVDWPFNKKIIQGQQKPFTPPEWSYSYGMPTDALKIRYLLPKADNVVDNRQISNDYGLSDQARVQFDLMLDDEGNQVICSNAIDVQVCYSAKIENVRVYGQMVSELIAWKLAQDLSITFGGDAGQRYRDNAERSFEKLKMQASAMYLNQSQPRAKQEMPRAVRARMGRTTTRG